MEKKLYRISISAEEYGCCYRELSKQEYNLIQGILDEAEPNYCSCAINEVELLNIVEVHHPHLDVRRQLVGEVILYRNRYVSSDDRLTEYCNVPKCVSYEFFENESDAYEYASMMADGLHCDVMLL